MKTQDWELPLLFIFVAVILYGCYRAYTVVNARTRKRLEDTPPVPPPQDAPPPARVLRDSVSSPYLPRPFMDAPISTPDLRIANLTSQLESELTKAMQKVSPASSERPPRTRLSAGDVKPRVPDLRHMVFIPGGEFWMGSDDKDDGCKSRTSTSIRIRSPIGSSCSSWRRPAT
ncbi:MAG: hypothetical protein ACYCW6_08685 [Candidatus Xenobia bacterium]